ncbi:MAG TPA: RhuM family protein [Kofleriaceae bacterium]|jgi:hypothetical protein|nr:RhuM family protein [Kofleriaceae bacterium]
MTDLVRQESEFLLYAAPNGAVKVRVLFRDETAWLTQRALAELFGVQAPAIAKHLKNIFDSGELDREPTISKMEIVATEGGREVIRQVEFYNLDAIIAVGYRVNSYQATQFRIWATRTLREFMIKGFVLDDERLKQGRTAFGKDYFDELLERIREIRASERRFYQKVADIYALSADYDSRAPLTREFFATVQNKLHWAITGQTAAELIYSSADATKLSRETGNSSLAAMGAGWSPTAQEARDGSTFPPGDPPIHTASRIRRATTLPHQAPRCLIAPRPRLH